MPKLSLNPASEPPQPSPAAWPRRPQGDAVPRAPLGERPLEFERGALCWQQAVLRGWRSTRAGRGSGAAVMPIVFPARQAPLSMGFSRQEYWSGLPFPPPGGLPDPRIKSTSLMSPALAGAFFCTSATWEALRTAWSASVQPFSYLSLRSTQAEQLYVRDILLTASPAFTEMQT